MARSCSCSRPGLGAAGIGISPATVRGIPDLPLSTIKSSRPVLGNPFNRGNATPLNAEQFHYAFGNTLSREDSDEIYKRYHVPAANRVLFQVANANLNLRTPVKGRLEATDRAPMLFIAAAEDHVVPRRSIRKTAEKYKACPSSTGSSRASRTSRATGLGRGRGLRAGLGREARLVRPNCGHPHPGRELEKEPY